MKSRILGGETPDQLVFDAAAELRRLYDEQQKEGRAWPRGCRVSKKVLQALEAKAAELRPWALTAPKRARR